MMTSHSLSRTSTGHQRPCSCLPQRPLLLSHSTQRSRTRVVQVTAAGSSSWYEQSSANRNSISSSSTAPSSGSSGQRQRSRHYYDTTPRSKQLRLEQSQNTSRRENDNEDGDEEGPGWWETPREVRAAQQFADAVAAKAGVLGLQLEPWQEQKLLLAASGSKKKMQVQTLAADLGLDRSEVLAWVADFRAKPKHEQAKLLAPLQGQIQEQRQQQTVRQQREEEQPSAAVGSGVQRTAAVPLPFSEPNPNTGYIPFAARRAAGAPKGKRLSGEALRTLEGVYDRSPWPSKEVVAGLFDLHKLPRDTVLDWFTARRDMDGLPHNPRQAKQARNAQQAAAAAPQVQQQQQEAAASAKQKQQQVAAGKAAAAAAAPTVASLTAKELASLRSALPSPKKFKGQKLAEELGIKTVTSAAGRAKVEIAGVTLVARDGTAAWRGAWRRRRAATGLPAQQLDFQKWFL